MITLYEIKNMPDARRVGRVVLLALIIWLLGFILLFQGLHLLERGREYIGETDSILKAANIVRSYPVLSTVSDGESLPEISSVIDFLGLKNRVSQMNSSQSGLVFSVEKIHTEELASLIESISEKGLYIKTAEIRAISSAKDGRLINATFAIGGEE